MLLNVDPLEHANVLDGYYDVKDQLKRHIYDRSFALFEKGDKDRDDLATREEVEARRERLRAAFIEAIGGLPPMDTPLNPRKCGEVACDGFRIEKIIIESRPKAYVTTNLYIPDGVTSPRGAVLFMCGHSPLSKGYQQYQMVCQNLVRAGLVVLAQDPFGQGERHGYWEPALGGATVDWTTREHDHAGLQALPLGDSICRYFVHDSMRAIDYLLSRPEVDPNKIGITGNSGGGTQTCMMMIADPRIAAAAPGTFVMNRKSYMLAGGPQDQEQIWLKMTALGFDHEDVLLMMAPKPVRVLAVTWDFFPIEATRRTVQRCKRLWEVCGNPGGLDIIEDQSLHCYTPKLASEAAKFFSNTFGIERGPGADGAVKPLDASATWCTVSGQVRGEIEGARFVYDENCDRLSELEARRAAVPERERQKQAIEWLRERVFAHRQPCDMNPRFLQQDTMQELRFALAAWWAQENVLNFGIMFRHFRFDGKNLPLTVAVWDGGCSSLRPHTDWIRRVCHGGRAVLVLNLSGIGKLAPYQIGTHPLLDMYGTVYKLSNDLYWLDDDIVALRVYDMIRALDVIEQWPDIDSRDLRVYASGLHSVYPRLAAAMDERISSVELAADALPSWAEWIRSRQYEQRDILSIILPGVLKYFDLPDVDRWATASSRSK
jgi:hypothetical protein